MDTGGASILKFKRSGDLIVGTVYATNMLDAMMVNDFGDEVLKVVTKYPRTHLLLNFENVDFLSSAALSELIRINEGAKQTKVVVGLCGVSEDILKVFKITKLDTMLSINEKDDVSTAIEKFKRSAERAAEEHAWEKKAKEGKLP